VSTETGQLQWFHSTEKVRRGFCVICGSSLFWDPIHKDWIGIAMGAFEMPTHTILKIHVHVAEKGDYYEIADGLPQNQHCDPAQSIYRRTKGRSN
jgi:hypothetical protein